MTAGRCGVLAAEGRACSAMRNSVSVTEIERGERREARRRIPRGQLRARCRCMTMSFQGLKAGEERGLRIFAEDVGGCRMRCRERVGCFDAFLMLRGGK
jgi:hypothetical protein